MIRSSARCRARCPGPQPRAGSGRYAHGHLGRIALAFALALGLGGCGGTQEAADTPKPRASADPGGAGDIPAGSVDRRLLEAILREGPPWVLERVPIEEVLDQGKFKGWRLQDFPAEWSHVELQPGDVVTALNGMPLETPDELWAAWATMGNLSEIKVSFVREGEAKELKVPIWGKADPTMAAQLASGKPPVAPPPADGGAPPAGSAPSPPAGTGKGEPGKKIPGIKETIVIHGNEKPQSDTGGEW
jgi:hypothetical protein